MHKPMSTRTSTPVIRLGRTEGGQHLMNGTVLLAPRSAATCASRTSTPCAVTVSKSRARPRSRRQAQPQSGDSAVQGVGKTTPKRSSRHFVSRPRAAQDWRGGGAFPPLTSCCFLAWSYWPLGSSWRLLRRVLINRDCSANTGPRAGDKNSTPDGVPGARKACLSLTRLPRAARPPEAAISDAWARSWPAFLHDWHRVARADLVTLVLGAVWNPHAWRNAWLKA